MGGDALLSLFDALPQFPVSLPDDELALLAILPDFGPDECVQEIEPEDEAACRRLAKRGLVQIRRWRADPAGHGTVMGAGKLPTAGLRALAAGGADGRA